MEDFNRKETFVELLIQEYNKRDNANIDKEDKYNVAILASLPEEILKLYIILSEIECGEISRKYIIEKLMRIMDDIPINMPPLLARHYVHTRDAIIRSNTPK